jgi:hypothetical protein
MTRRKGTTRKGKARATNTSSSEGEAFEKASDASESSNEAPPDRGGRAVTNAAPVQFVAASGPGSSGSKLRMTCATSI